MGTDFQSRTATAAVFSCAVLLATAGFARAADRGSADPLLTAAVTHDRAIQAACGNCIRKAEWIGSGYLRLTVDGGTWAHVKPAQRTALARRALAAASKLYLREWAADDLYQRVFVVDRGGAPLMSFQP